MGLWGLLWHPYQQETLDVASGTLEPGAPTLTPIWPPGGQTADKLSPTPLQRISWGREQVLGARGAPGEPPLQILDPAIPQPWARGGAGAPGAAQPFS